MTRLPERNLDVLRSIAVLCVLGCHAVDPWIQQIGPISSWQLGRMGVVLFFIHTSLVLMASLERLEQSIESRWTWTKAFYIRRAFRIYPLAIAAILVVLAFKVPVFFMNRGPHPAYDAPSWLTIASNLLLVQNLTSQPDLLGPLWSLPLEVEMYVLLPMLYLLAKRSWPATLAAVVIAIIDGLAVRHAPIPGIWRLTVFVFAPCFMAGIVAYRICRTRGDSAPPLPAWAWPFTLAAAFGVFVLTNPTAEHLELVWPFCFAVALGIPFVRELPDSWLTRAAATVAKYSYGIYLSHVILLWLSFVVLYHAPRAMQWITFGTTVVVVPILLYHFIEAPGIRLGIRLAHGKASSIRSKVDASTVPAP